MCANINSVFTDWLKNIALRLFGMIFFATVFFASPTGPCHGAEPPVCPMLTQITCVHSDKTPSADEIADVVSTRFHVGMHDALEIGHAVLQAARRYTISPLLLLAMIAVESSFDRLAISAVGAKGLMQVLPSRHRDRVLRTSDLTDARTNVRIGSAILQDYITASDGDLEDALHRYSGGAKGYARRVAEHFAILKAEFGL